MAVAMIEPSFYASLVAAIGTPPVPKASGTAAGEAAIAMATVTVRADPEHRVTCAVAANPLKENRFAVDRHAPSLGVAGQRQRFMSG